MSIFGPTASHSAKFEQPGTIVEGRVTDIGDPFHATKFGSQEKDYWPSGDPIMNVSVTLQTNDRDPQDPEDDGQRRIYVTVSGKEGGQLWAIRAALKAARQKDLAVGGYLKVQFTGYDPESKNQQNPRKLYRAAYTAPAGAFSVDTPPAPAAQAPAPQAPAPVLQAPAYAAAPAQDPWGTPAKQQPPWGQPADAGEPPF
jgi:hypothetical protein